MPDYVRVILLILFLFFVSLGTIRLLNITIRPFPDHQERRAACAALGGVLVLSTETAAKQKDACISRSVLLKEM